MAGVTEAQRAAIHKAARAAIAQAGLHASLHAKLCRGQQDDVLEHRCRQMRAAAREAFGRAVTAGEPRE